MHDLPSSLRTLLRPAVVPPRELAPRRHGVLRGSEARLAATPFEASMDLSPEAPLAEAGLEGAGDVVVAGAAFLDEEMLAAAQATGYAAGLAAGQAEAEAARADLAAAQAAWAEERAVLEAAMATALGQVRAGYDRFMHDLEPQLAELAIGAAEALLMSPVGVQAQDAMFQALGTALKRFGGGTPVTISLPLGDIEELRMSGIAEHLEQHLSPLHWQVDGSLEPGDWCLNAEEGAVRRVRAEMMDELRQHLGLKALSA